MTDTVSVRKGDLGILVAAVTGWAPRDVALEASEAFARLLTAFDEAHADDEYRITEAGKAAADEDKPAKVIIVTEPNADGAPGRETRYNATQWDVTSTYGLLALLRSGHPVALFQSPGWLSVREDDAVPDSTAKALGIAKLALLDILKRSEDGGEQPFGRPEIGGIAQDALEDIWNETDA